MAEVNSEVVLEVQSEVEEKWKVGFYGDGSQSFPKSDYEKMVDTVAAEVKMLDQDPPVESQYYFRDRFKAALKKRFDARLREVHYPSRAKHKHMFQLDNEFLF